MIITFKKNTQWLLLAILSALFAQIGFAERPANLPEPLTKKDFIQASKESIKLGQLLFFDPILSGNKNIACATCHHPDLGTADGVALSIGEGGKGLGVDRKSNKHNPPEQLIGRNSPALFNLGAKQYTSFFHDGRLQNDASLPNGIRSPLGEDMLAGFTSLLSAQAMFPMASPDEMAGHYNENEIAKALRKGQISGENGAWHKITQRIQRNAEYVGYFKSSVSQIKQASDIQFTDIANAIANFIAYEWQAINSPFDDYLRGNNKALPPLALDGMTLFYGKAKCSTCHSGALQTDHNFHAIAIPQFGPGKVARFEKRKQDTGRMRVTGKPEDAYKFRTPSLRNITLTAPYGHDGAFATLKDIVRHHLNPIESLQNFDYSKVVLPKLEKLPALAKLATLTTAPTQLEVDNIIKANEIEKKSLSELEINALEAFLKALTDKDEGAGRLGRPKRVPSGFDFD